MPIDPVTGALVMGGLNAIGGFFGGRAQSKSADKDRQLQKEQFDRRQGFEEGQAAVGLERMQSNIPLRDMVQYQLMGRLGMGQQPVSAWGGAQQFIPQVQAQNAHTAAYTPGAGGVKDAVLQQMLQRLATPTAPATEIQSPIWQRRGFR